MNQLIAELDGLAEDLARDGAAGVETVASASQQLGRLERENTELRNEIARLNGQTNWVCKCGGTDCEGQKENAALRTVLKRWIKVADDCHREQQEVGYSEYNITAGLMVDTRALLDAARKEAQP